MAAGVSFFAIQRDEQMLLDAVLTSESIRIFHWTALDVANPTLMTRDQLPPPTHVEQDYGVVDLSLGPIRFHTARPENYDPQVYGTPASFVADLRNWEAWTPAEGQGIVDWNRTPALLWRRGGSTVDGRLCVSNLGSQADAMHAVSHDFRKWVNRTMNWVRRKGVLVARMAELTPAARGFSIELESIASSIFALPGAMEHFHAGGGGKIWS